MRQGKERKEYDVESRETPQNCVITECCYREREKWGERKKEGKGKRRKKGERKGKINRYDNGMLRRKVGKTKENKR